jgi:hypothetical protein
VSIVENSDAASDGSIAVYRAKIHRRGRRAAHDSLNSSASTVHEKRYDRSDQKYDEQYLCNPRRSGGNATETKQSGY